MNNRPNTRKVQSIYTIPLNMKKTVLLGVFAMLIGLSSFARSEEEVCEAILQSFKKEFVGAQDVIWEISKTRTKATFKLSGQVMFAYFQDNGELIAVVHNITSAQLPITLLMDIKKNYQDYWITDLFEISGEGTSSYFVTLQSADQTIVLKSDGAQSWNTFRKMKSL